jgi:hypothetical protein
VTFLGGLGAVVLKGITALPPVKDALERDERVAEITSAAQKTAYRDLDDEAAKTALTELLQQRAGDPSEALARMTRFANAPREDYISDRAYRLLAASVGETDVAQIPPDRSELFAREASLGRLPINEAFAVLGEIEPRLLGVERQAPGTELRDGGGLPPELSMRLGEMVGGAAALDDELLRSTLASSIAHHYLRALAGDLRCGPTDMPFFENPRKSFSVTIALRRPKAGERR